MKTLKKTFMTALCLVTLTTSAWAIDLSGVIGTVVGTAVGGYVVEKFADPLNKFINTVTFNKGIKAEGYTKVVPIVSIGSGTRIGAAQVSGPKKDGVDKCKAVAQLEVDFQDTIRAKILVPIDRLNVTQGFKRVQGVGVSAIVDVKL